jgi:hypothetical protein
MTRGRQPLIALREAGQIARKRGEVRHFAHEPGMICHFVIYCMFLTAHVRIKRVSRLRCPLSVIEREAADALTTLRAIAPGPGISRELWVYLPRGSFRFFRVTETGLVALDRDGVVIPAQPEPAPARPATPAPPAGQVSSPPNQAPLAGVSVGDDLLKKDRVG